MILAQNVIEGDAEAARVHGERPRRGHRPLAAGDAIFTISDMASAFNVTLRALRFYEKRGLLQPQREGRDRLYCAADRERLELILKGKRLGFTLAEIQTMLSKRQIAGRPTGHATALTLRPDQVLTQISHLEGQIRDLEQAIAELRAVHRGLAEA